LLLGVLVYIHVSGSRLCMCRILWWSPGPPCVLNYPPGGGLSVCASEVGEVGWVSSTSYVDSLAHSS
jgi:hypothetical protein